MKKNLSVLTIVILLIIGLTGCYSKEEKELAKQYEKRGKEYAIKYIEEKYNFKPKIESVTSLRNCNSVWGCLESSPSDKVEIKMIANNKTYSVMVYGLTDNNLWAADDYQYEKIEKDLINYFKENIPFSLYDYKLNFLDLITDYYSNNLENVLKYIGSIELYYVGENNLDII